MNKHVDGDAILRRKEDVRRKINEFAGKEVESVCLFSISCEGQGSVTVRLELVPCNDGGVYINEITDYPFDYETSEDEGIEKGNEEGEWILTSYYRKSCPDLKNLHKWVPQHLLQACDHMPFMLRGAVSEVWAAQESIIKKLQALGIDFTDVCLEHGVPVRI